MTEPKVYEVYEESRNDPDNAPNKPALHGMWVWWRTGPHPQGVWQAMDMDGTTPQGQAGLEAQRKNWDEHPIFQDQAFGDHGDFGNFSCHACDYFSDGYPEPNHKTNCDGICKRPGCRLHGQGGKDAALAELERAFEWALSRGLTRDELKGHLFGGDE